MSRDNLLTSPPPGTIWARRNSADARIPEHGESSTGWSYNRTAPSLPSESGAESEPATYSSARSKRSSANPLRLLLDRALWSPTSSNAPSTPYSPGRPDSRTGTALSSPPFSDAILTPRSEASELHSHVQIYSGTASPPVTDTAVDFDDDRKLRGRHRAGSFPFSLMSAFRGPSTAPASSVQSDRHSNSSGTPTSLVFPSPTQHTFASSEKEVLRTPNTSQQPWSGPSSAGLLGLGLDQIPQVAVTGPTDELRPPRSPGSSVGSPSPGSPLLGADAQPALQFQMNRPASRPASPRTRSLKSFMLGSALPQPRSYHPSRSKQSSSAIWPISALETALPAQSLLVLGFFLGPWCWLIGGWYLRFDGELPNTRAGICRCKRDANGQPSSEACPASAQRRLRLLGAKSTGRGLCYDAKQLLDDPALSEHHYRTNQYVKANRIAAGASGVVILLGVVCAILAAAGTI